MSDIGILNHLPEQLAIIGLVVVAVIVLIVVYIKRR
jgi:hypothetical protein